VRARKYAAVRASEDPQQAFRLLRHLVLAEVLWGRDVALPIAALGGEGRAPRMRILRALLQLERDGAVVLYRMTRAVRLSDALSLAS
jgi:hypothetical protein